MPSCCVPKCKNRSEQGIRLFQIPRGKTKQEKTKAWTKFVNRGELPFRASICEAHFEKNQFESGRADNRTLLKWNAVPTIGVREHQSPHHHRKAIDNCNSTHEADSSLKLADHVGEASAENEDDFVPNLQFQRLKSKLKNALQKISSLESRIKKMEERYNGIFNEDQLKFLKNGSHRGEEWSDHTINKGLRLYRACGADGYAEIREQGLPYPSTKWLSTLVYYDNSLNKINERPTMKLFGNEESAEALATHALVLMLAGISSRWKQTVGHEFTAASYSAEEVLDKVFHLIRRAHETGITIRTVISDMGPQN